MTNNNSETFFIENNHKQSSEYHSILLNIGNCSTSIVSKSSLCKFPSFAIHHKENENIKVNNNLILYSDENGQEWVIGEEAKKSSISVNSSTDPMAIYESSRWDDILTLVISRVGIAAGIRTTDGAHTKDSFKAQLGLPPSYFERDISEIFRKMLGKHTYRVKFGNRPWETFDYELDKNNLTLINQPDDIPCHFMAN